MTTSASVSAQRAPWVEHGAPPLWLASFALLYAGYCVVGTQLSDSHPPLSWPAAGVILVALGVTRVVYWWRIALVATAISFVALWVFGDFGSMQLTLYVSLVRTIEGMIGAWLMKANVAPPWHRRTSQEITSNMVVAALVSASAGALLMFAIEPQPYSTPSVRVYSFLFWWLSTFTGVVLFSPVFGALILLANAGRSKLTGRTLYGLLYSIIAVVAAVWLVSFDSGSYSLRTDHSLFIAGIFLMPSMIWLADRIEPLFVTCLFTIIAVGALHGLEDPKAPMGSIYFGDKSRSAGVVLYIAGCAMAAFIRSINAFERRHAIKLLTIRQGPGMLVTKIATTLAQPMDGAIQDRLEKCLQRVGKYAGADRCVIALFDEDRKVASEADSWVRPGIPASDAMSQNLPYSVFNGGIESLQSGRSQFARQKNYPAGTIIGDYLRQINTRSTGFVPLRNGSNVIGALGLAWVRDDITWSSELIATLRSVGEILGGTLSRVEAEQIAERYRRKLQEFRDDRHRVDELLRREIATDLHDGAAQNLAVARLKLGQYAKSFPTGSDSIAEIDKLVVTSLNEIRGIIDRAGSTTLYEFGLAAAITEYLTHASDMAGFDIEFTVDCATTHPEQERSAFLYRACRELVTNAIKHSQADNIRVILRQDDQRYTLSVSDNGKGMSETHYQPDAAGNTGFGLFSLSESVASLAGQIDISSTEEGTVVVVDVAAGKS